MNYLPHDSLFVETDAATLRKLSAEPEVLAAVVLAIRVPVPILSPARVAMASSSSVMRSAKCRIRRRG